MIQELESMLIRDASEEEKEQFREMNEQEIKAINESKVLMK